MYKLFFRKILLLIDFACIFLGRFLSKNISADIVFVKVDAIGDFIIWLASAKNLNKLPKESNIILIVNNNLVEFAEQFPYWSSVYGVDIHRLRYSLIYRLKTLFFLSSINSNIVIQPTYTRIILLGDSIVRAIKSKMKIGNSGDLTYSISQDYKTSSKWYSHLFDYTKKSHSELEFNLHFFNYCFPKISSHGHTLADLSGILSKSNKFYSREEYIVLFPGASWIGRSWETSKFIALIDLLVSKHNYKIVLAGGTSDFDICNKIASTNPIQIINLCNKTSLLELVQLISKSKLLISNETSALHISMALGIKTVCILGGGHFGRFFPYPNKFIQNNSNMTTISHNMECFGCNWNCIYSRNDSEPVSCISIIDVEAVYNATLRLLNDV